MFFGYILGLLFGYCAARYDNATWWDVAIAILLIGFFSLLMEIAKVRREIKAEKAEKEKQSWLG